MELFMPNYSACCLGSINLSQYVNPETGAFKYDELFADTQIATRALDVIIDEGADRHALPQQKEVALKWRQVGLGFYGLADALIMMRLTYGDKDAQRVAGQIVKTMYTAAFSESVRLAAELGSYPKCDVNTIKESRLYRRLLPSLPKELINEFEEFGMRNATLLALAPTGSIATLQNVSTSLEPVFATSYTRTTKTLHDRDVTYKVYPNSIKWTMECFECTEDNLPPFVITANDISWRDRIDMQASIQEWVDASISSTVNLPNSATVEDVEDLYMYAWKKRIKGITIFRDGCLREGILQKISDEEPALDTSKSKSVSPHTGLGRGDIIQCDDTLIGRKRKLQSGCGSLHLSVWADPESGDILEVYLSRGSTGGCTNSLTGLSRMISIAARGGVAIEEICDQLKSSGACPSYAVRSAKYHDTSKGSCCPAAIAYALEEIQEEIYDTLDGDSYDDVRAEIDRLDTRFLTKTDSCPECGESLRHEGGCLSCIRCGYSKCD